MGTGLVVDVYRAGWLGLNFSLVFILLLLYYLKNSLVSTLTNHSLIVSIDVQKKVKIA